MHPSWQRIHSLTRPVIAQQLPGARLVVMPGAAHLPNKQPGRFTQVVLQFLVANRSVRHD